MNYISLTEAAARCDYSQEYLSLRARQGKLKAVKQGRNWVTTHAWLMDYLHQVDQTKRELQLGVPTVATPTISHHSDTETATKDTLHATEKVREEIRFQPVVPRSWLDDSDEQQLQQPVAFLDQESFWDAAPKQVAAAKQEAQEKQSVDHSVVLPITRPSHSVQDSVADQYVDQSEQFHDASTDTDTVPAISEESDEITERPNHSFAWVRPLVFAVFAFVLLIEIGVLARPIVASVTNGEFTTSTTVASNLSNSQSQAGRVAGVSIDKTADTSKPTVMQKVAAGLRLVVDDPYDGEVTTAGQWLTDTFHLPAE